MVRQVVIAVLVFIYPLMADGEELCLPQDYDSIEQPDFACPGPSERDLTPDFNSEPSVPLEIGDTFVAEWDGAFVDRSRLTELGLRVRMLRRLRWADRLRLRREFETYLEYLQEMGRIELDHMVAQRDAYRDQLAQANERIGSSQSWWRSPTLWLAVGVVVTTGLVAVAAYGLSAAGG